MTPVQQGSTEFSSILLATGLHKFLWCRLRLETMTPFKMQALNSLRHVNLRGYFQGLFACIERLLSSLKVKHFVLPPADETASIWTQRFGFGKMIHDELLEHLKGGHTMVLHGTSILHKPVPVRRLRRGDRGGSGGAGGLGVRSY